MLGESMDSRGPLLPKPVQATCIAWLFYILTLMINDDASLRLQVFMST